MLKHDKRFMLKHDKRSKKNATQKNWWS